VARYLARETDLTLPTRRAKWTRAPQEMQQTNNWNGAGPSLRSATTNSCVVQSGQAIVSGSTSSDPCDMRPA
jgi:hypothetical protein